MWPRRRRARALGGHSVLGLRRALLALLLVAATLADGGDWVVGGGSLRQIPSLQAKPAIARARAKAAAAAPAPCPQAQVNTMMSQAAQYAKAKATPTAALATATSAENHTAAPAKYPAYWYLGGPNPNSTMKAVPTAAAALGKTPAEGLVFLLLTRTPDPHSHPCSSGGLRHAESLLTSYLSLAKLVVPRRRALLPRPNATLSSLHGRIPDWVRWSAFYDLPDVDSDEFRWASDVVGTNRMVDYVSVYDGRIADKMKGSTAELLVVHMHVKGKAQCWDYSPMVSALSRSGGSTTVALRPSPSIVAEGLRLFNYVKTTRDVATVVAVHARRGDILCAKPPKPPPSATTPNNNPTPTTPKKQCNPDGLTKYEGTSYTHRQYDVATSPEGIAAALHRLGFNPPSSLSNASSSSAAAALPPPPPPPAAGMDDAKAGKRAAAADKKSSMAVLVFTNDKDADSLMAPLATKYGYAVVTESELVAATTDPSEWVDVYSRFCLMAQVAAHASKMVCTVTNKMKTGKCDARLVDMFKGKQKQSF
jgi:hypothetical protein